MKDELADRVFQFIVSHTETYSRPPSVQRCAEACQLTTYRVRQAVARLRQQQRISPTSLRLLEKRAPKPRLKPPAKPRVYPRQWSICVQILSVIVEYERVHQQMPTVRELAGVCGYAVSVQHRWLRILEAEGYIERTRQARGIRLLAEVLPKTA